MLLGSGLTDDSLIAAFTVGLPAIRSWISAFTYNLEGAMGDYAWWDQLLAPFGGTGGCCDSRDDHVRAVIFHLNILAARQCVCTVHTQNLNRNILNCAWHF